MTTEEVAEQAKTGTPAIVVDNISKQYDGRTVLKNINFTVNPGEIMAIVGPSGCGKSTLLRIMCGLEQPDEGNIEMTDDNFTLVFQYSALFDSLSVFENVAFSFLEDPDTPMKRQNRKKVKPDELHRMVKEKLEMLELGDIQDLYPNQLSGGMQKRVSFARAIMSDPQIIFYDEPTAGLDPIAATVIDDSILGLRNQLGATSVVVTHNLSTIRKVDKVCLLFNGEIKFQGTGDEFFKSDNAYTVQFANASLEGPMTA